VAGVAAAGVPLPPIVVVAPAVLPGGAPADGPYFAHAFEVAWNLGELG
jgi:hypothetical protein